MHAAEVCIRCRFCSGTVLPSARYTDENHECINACRRTPKSWRFRIASIAVGAKHTLLLGEDGALFGIGSNACGQLGIPFQKHLKFTKGLLRGHADASDDNAEGGAPDDAGEAGEPRGPAADELRRLQVRGQVEHFEAAMVQVGQRRRCFSRTCARLVFAAAVDTVTLLNVQLEWAPLGAQMCLRDIDLGPEFDLFDVDAIKAAAADAEAAARAAEAAEDALELADNADYATAAARAVERGDENSPTVFPVGFQVSALKELTLQQLAHELFARSMSVPSLVAKQHKLTPAEEDKSRATMTKALTFVVSRELEKARRNRADLRRKRREAREERAQQLRKVCHSLRAASRVLTVRHVVLRIVRHSRSSTPPKNARSDVGARSYHSASSPSQPALLTPCASRIADWCLRLGTTAGDSSVRPHGKVKWWTICVRGMCDM